MPPPVTITGAKYVLVDFENVQPGNLELLKEHPFCALVFIGANPRSWTRSRMNPRSAT